MLKGQSLSFFTFSSEYYIFHKLKTDVSSFFLQKYYEKFKAKVILNTFLFHSYYIFSGIEITTTILL